MNAEEFTAISNRVAQLSDELADSRAGMTAANTLIGDLRVQRDALADVAVRLLASHQVMSPHHKDSCELCRDAAEAIRLAAPSVPQSLLRHTR